MSNRTRYGLVYFDLNIPKWADILAQVNMDYVYTISGSDGYGLEWNSHLTVISGFGPDINDESVLSIIDEFKSRPFRFSIESLGYFNHPLRPVPNTDFRVLKFNVKPDDNLMAFNRALSKLPHTNIFGGYIPHVTVAYLKLDVPFHRFIPIHDRIQHSIEFTIGDIVYENAGRHYRI